MAIRITNEHDAELVRDILGYMNFSSGRPDAAQMKAWDELFVSAREQGSVERWTDVLGLLKSELAVLARDSSIYKDSRQAAATIEALEKTLAEYRVFHADTLFGPTNEYLYNSFFMARATSVVVAHIQAEGLEPDVSLIIESLNDFLGYRPIPVLEGGEKHEPNQHEWVGALPIWREDVGAADGPYKNIVLKALDIINDTNESILSDASYYPDKLTEVAVDPRQYDYDHPVNRRVNYAFGTWDDRIIDQSGYFRRFIVHRTMIDAILSRVLGEKDPALRESYEYEAGAVLAGTILMASGICGGRVQAYDSTVSLNELTQTVAQYRDQFYKELLEKAPAKFRPRLEIEAQKLRQPFGGGRHALNRCLAQQRANQLQRFSLARTYARMGYFEASKIQANSIETTSARMLTSIDCLITKAHFLADAGKIAEAEKIMPEIEEGLHRGIACGAFPDPWFILGFDGEYSLFPAPDNSIHDHRLDGMIELLNDIFDLYSRLMKEAAVAGDRTLRLDLSDRMQELADWWDQFGSTETSAVEGFSGQEVWESATRVSNALAAWSAEGGAVGDVAFWRKHIEQFNSPKAFVLLGESLLDRRDLISSESLLIYWLDRSPEIPLSEADYTFTVLADNWLEEVWAPDDEEARQAGKRRRSTPNSRAEMSREDYLRRWKLTKNFIARVEANADDFWTVPKLELDKSKFDRKIAFKTDNPLLAELARRLILSVRKFGSLPDGRPKVVVKSSFRDAARVFNSENIPKPQEFERFYNENAKVFPSYISFQCFMEVLLGALRLTGTVREEFNRFMAEKTRKYFSVSNPKYSPAKNAKKGRDSQKELTADQDEALLLQEELDKLIAESGINPELAKEILQKMHDLKDDDPEEESIENNWRSLAETAPGEYDDSIFDTDPWGDEEDTYEPGDEPDQDEDTVTGGDPTFSAAYEHMTWHDSADDGIDDDTAPGGNSSGGYREPEGEHMVFAKETERVSERLTFICMTALMWKTATVRSPLQNYMVEGGFDDATLKTTRLDLESWLKQAVEFEKDLYELLDQAARYRVPKPSGSTESMIDYDQHRGAKELLLDRIVWTVVEIEDAILHLRATLRVEESDSYEKPWKTTVLRTMSAIFRRDVAAVRKLWPNLLKQLGGETLLYVPTGRGGDARAIVESRRLHQIVVRLLGFAPKLGLYRETFQLIDVVKRMEQNRLSSPGSITEYDRLVEVALRSITSALADSVDSWAAEARDGDDALDVQLFQLVEETMSIISGSWVDHSSQIRISSVEGFAHDERWKFIRQFIKEYGADLFTQQFLAFRNLRAILHQGAGAYVHSLVEMSREGEQLDCGASLVEAIEDGKIPEQSAGALLEAVIECVAEFYSEYVDYNSTTTQSDKGDMLYIFVDFMRTLASYERTSWNIRPYCWVHDALIRSKCLMTANRVKREVESFTSDAAKSELDSYNRKSAEYGVWLQSVYNRLSENFIRPFEIAQLCGLVFDAISLVRSEGENNPVFSRLSAMAEEFASRPDGVGFDLPEWLSELQDEVMAARVDSKEERRLRDQKEQFFDAAPFPPLHVSVAEFMRQVNSLPTVKPEKDFMNSSDLEDLVRRLSDEELQSLIDEDDDENGDE